MIEASATTATAPVSGASNSAAPGFDVVKDSTGSSSDSGKAKTPSLASKKREERWKHYFQPALLAVGGGFVDTVSYVGTFPA